MNLRLAFHLVMKRYRAMILGSQLDPIEVDPFFYFVLGFDD